MGFMGVTPAPAPAPETPKLPGKTRGKMRVNDLTIAPGPIRFRICGTSPENGERILE